MRLLLYLLALLALLAGGLGGFWWLGGPDAHRWVARRALELAFDREVEVDGSFDLEFGAEPLLRLTGLRVGSPPWAETPNQLQIARAQVRIALRPLLNGVLLLPLIDLEGVTVALEIAADGRYSWYSDGATAPRSGSGSGVPLLGRVSISDATVTYHDQRDGRRIRAHIATLTQDRDAASGGMRLDARGDVNGDTFRIGGTSGSLETALNATGAWPLDLEIEAPSIDAKLTGTVADVARAAGLDMRLEARSPSVLAAARTLHVSLPVDAQTTMSARLRGDLAAPAFDQISVEMEGAGDSRLSVAGSLGAAASEGGMRLESFDLMWTLAVPKPSAFADRLGVDLSGLGALRGQAELSLTDQRIVAKRLTIDAADLGALHVEGSGALASLTGDGGLELKPAISLTAGMTASRPLLAIFDPNAPELGPLHATGDLVRDDAGYRLDEIELALGTPDKLALEAQGKLGPLIADDLSATELALAVRIGWPSGETLEPLVPFDLSVLGRAEGEFGLDGTLASLRLHDARLETSSAADITLVATGGIASVRTKPPFGFDGIAFALDGSAPSTVALARQLGTRCPDFGPLQASASLEGGPGPLALRGIRLVVGPAAAPSIEVSGAVGDAVSFEKLELTGDFKLPARDLLACAEIHGNSDVGSLLGKVHLSDADGSLGVEHLEGEIRETDLLSLSMEGTVDDLENLDQVRFQTSLEVPKIADLAAVFDADGVGLERFQFDGELSGGAHRFDADGHATLGETRIDGSLAGDFRAARPGFRARLHSPRLRLVDLGLAPEASSDAPTADQAPAGARGYLFGPEPFPLAALDKADLDLEVQLDSVEGVVLAVDRATAHVVLKDGRLQVSPAGFEVVGGHARLDAEVDARAPTPTWRIKAEADDFALGDAWRQLETEVPLSGELDLLLDLQASGRSPRDLASSLEGDLNLALERGRIRSRLFGLTTMNPLRWLTARSTRRGYSRIDCFIASFQVDKGVAALRKLLLETPDATATGAGSIDFARETMDILIHPSPKHSLVELATPFAITGSLADPSVQASAAGATARAMGRVVAGPVNFLGSLLSFIDDRGRDRNNPCLRFFPTEAGTP